MGEKSGGTAESNFSGVRWMRRTGTARASGTAKERGLVSIGVMADYRDAVTMAAADTTIDRGERGLVMGEGFGSPWIMHPWRLRDGAARWPSALAACK